MVDKKELSRIIQLAKISVTENEFESLTKDMSNIIKFADEINSAISDNDDFEDINDLSNIFRDDIVEESFSQESILSNANGGKNGFFYLRKYQKK